MGWFWEDGDLTGIVTGLAWRRWDFGIEVGRCEGDRAEIPAYILYNNKRFIKVRTRLHSLRGLGAEAFANVLGRHIYELWRYRSDLIARNFPVRWAIKLARQLDIRRRET